MSELKIFAKRNIMVYWKNKSAILTSMFGVIIVFGIYILFLGDSMFRDIQGKNVINTSQLKLMLNQWLMAGIIAISTISASFGALNSLPSDREKHIIKDFYVSPLKRVTISGGYLLAGLISDLVMSVLVIICAQVYILLNGGSMFNLKILLEMCCIIIVTVFSSCSMVYFIATLSSDERLYSNVFSILSILLGFIAGIYMPIGQLPTFLQFIVKIFPTSYGAALLRHIMTNDTIKIVFGSHAAGLKEYYMGYLGYNFRFGNYTTSRLFGIMYLLVSGIIFFAASVIVISRKKKK